MTFHTKKLPLTALAGLALLAACALPVHAQWSGNFRSPSTMPSVDPGASVGTGYGSNPGFQAPTINIPTYNTGPYTPYYDPYGGFMQGVAAVNQAQGEFLIQQEQAKVVGEQAKQAKLDTRRKSFDQYLYERDRRPSNEDERERARMLNLRRARNNPPPTEIWSGKALNDLLDGLQKMHAQHVSGPTIPLNPDILSKINVTTGTTEGSLGQLRGDGKLQWPYALSDTPYDADRKKLDELAAGAYKEAEYGRVKPATIRSMTKTVDDLAKKLKKNIKDITPSDYVDSKRFLNDMEQTIKVLRDPNVSNYVTKKWAAKGDTVSELVQNMTNQGLKFAPATRGDEAAYTALHSALVQYYSFPSQPWDPFAK
jgi:hypothetical protein